MPVRGLTGDPRENPPTRGLRPARFPLAEIRGVTQPGIEPISPRWEASALAVESSPLQCVGRNHEDYTEMRNEQSAKCETNDCMKLSITSALNCPHSLLNWGSITVTLQPHREYAPQHAKFALLFAIRLNLAVLYIPEPVPSSQWLLHGREATPFMAELNQAERLYRLLPASATQPGARVCRAGGRPTRGKHIEELGEGNRAHARATYRWAADPGWGKRIPRATSTQAPHAASRSIRSPRSYRDIRPSVGACVTHSCPPLLRTSLDERAERWSSLRLNISSTAKLLETGKVSQRNQNRERNRPCPISKEPFQRSPGMTSAKQKTEIRMAWPGLELRFLRVRDNTGWPPKDLGGSNIEVLRVDEGMNTEQCRNARGGKREIPEKTRLPAISPSTFPTCESPGIAPPGIERCSP
ncbi:hypothetical protein PR048_022552 [Dryococelus australis]|uniref:Uncharacterized protein n=1 Tax=Dryococelus australis TaxID=614101 RepID=A0ABQ9H199_9NEOP|nr:hypothetical protein PR048_022552 [Dryococelus australis]